jgi:hypothetical protein
MYYNIKTQGGDALITQLGSRIVTTHHSVLGGGKVSGRGAVTETKQVVVVGKDTWFFIQYYKNGVRQLPPTGGGVVSGYPLNISVYIPSRHRIVTQKGDPIITQLGEYLLTQTYYPMGGSLVRGYPVLGVVWSPLPVYGGGWVRSVQATVTPLWANHIIASHIGAMDFTYDDSGEVVSIFMPWFNWVYAMRRIGNSGVVVYGENGVVLLTPHGTAWGQRNITQVGIKGKMAVCTNQDDTEHYFIDEQGFFWHIKEGQPASRTDFSNYFGAMNDNTVMTWDHKHDIIYICDGVHGYIWTKGGLGQGPANISGLGVRWGEDLFVVGPSSIFPDPFETCTDILDFGCRTEKTIGEVFFGITLPIISAPILDQDGNIIYDQDGNILSSQYAQNDVYAAVDYRWESSSAFVTSPWVKVDASGRAYFMATGVEFRIRAKLLYYAEVQLDYVNIKVLHDDLKPLGMGG